MLGFDGSMLNSTACQPSCVIFELCFAHFVFGSAMATVERPEVEIVSGEAPAVAGAGEVNEIAVPSPKASGPAGPPATPSTVVGGGDPNMNGHTVTGPLMVDVDLLEVPLDNLLALGMGSANFRMTWCLTPASRCPKLNRNVRTEHPMRLRKLSMPSSLRWIR